MYVLILCNAYVTYFVYYTIYHLRSLLISSQETNCHGDRLFCEPNIPICREHIVLFLRIMFIKFFGHSQFLEICATSKEAVLFRDNDFVLLRFACGYNSSSCHGSWHNVMVD